MVVKLNREPRLILKWLVDIYIYYTLLKVYLNDVHQGFPTNRHTQNATQASRKACASWKLTCSITRIHQNRSDNFCPGSQQEHNFRTESFLEPLGQDTFVLRPLETPACAAASWPLPAAGTPPERQSRGRLSNPWGPSPRCPCVGSN